MSARKYTFDEIWHLVVKHRWLILVPVAIGLAAAPLFARFAPLRYRSEALILVVPPQVPDAYVAQTVTESVEERLPSITTKILSRFRLERIILDMDLYRAERATQVMEDVVERMRLRDVQTSATGKDTDSFRISYVSDNAATAQEVTQRLTQLYIEQNALERQRESESTAQLLAGQLENTKQRLSEQEKKLEAYQQAYAGQLPSQLPGNLQAIASLSMQLQQVSQAINGALERRMRAEREMGALDMVPLQRDGVAGAATEPQSTAELLEATRRHRASLLQRYTSGHPDVKDAEQRIVELTERLEREAPLSARTTALEKPMTPAEAAQQRRRLDLQAELEVIDHSLSQYRSEEGRLKKSISDYQARVNVVPTRESELTELTREYTALNTAYADLLLKRENASLAANMERRQIGEQFTILDPASRPEKPYNELQRYAVMASGAVGGLMLAIAVIGLREYRDSSFRSKEEVMSALSLPVLASIPVMVSAPEREASARRSWAMDIGGSVLLLASIAVVVVWKFSQ